MDVMKYSLNDIIFCTSMLVWWLVDEAVIVLWLFVYIYFYPHHFSIQLASSYFHEQC